MELGNILFGNSRGEYLIADRKSFEDILIPLLQKVGLDERGYSENGYINNTGATFDNDIFTIRPYYWGDDESIAELPNFIYKPSNIEINWYKYPLRDSYINTEITIEDFRDIIHKCIESVGRNEV